MKTAVSKEFILRNIYKTYRGGIILGIVVAKKKQNILIYFPKKHDGQWMMSIPME